MKKIILIFALAILLFNCKKETNNDFESLTKSYFEDKNSLDPLSATQNGFKKFDDKLVFEMTDSYRKAQKTFFDKYQNSLKSINEINFRKGNNVIFCFNTYKYFCRRNFIQI